MASNHEQVVNLAEWYNAGEAAARLTANSGKEIKVSYVRTLARYKKVRTLNLSDRVHLYSRADIDNYVVEERGEKSGRAKRQQAVSKNRPTKAVA